MQDLQESGQNASLLGIGEAAEFTGVSIDTLRRWEKKGKIKTFRSPGGHRYFQRHELQQVFGTKYQRDEISHLKKASPKIDVEEKQEPTAQALPKSEPDKTASVIKDYYRDKLSVPRYITHETISKYDYAFRNRSQSAQDPKVESNFQTTPQIESSQASILTPTPQAKTQESSITKIRINYKKVAIIAFAIFIIVDLILLIIWATTPKIISPLA